MDGGDTATLLQFQRLPQAVSEPSKPGFGERGRAGNRNGSCGEEATIAVHTREILVETRRTILQNPELENLHQQSWQWNSNPWEHWYKLWSWSWCLGVWGPSLCCSEWRWKGVMNLHLSLEFWTCRDLLPLYFYLLYGVQVSTFPPHNCYFWKHGVYFQGVLARRELSEGWVMPWLTATLNLEDALDLDFKTDASVSWGHLW